MRYYDLVIVGAGPAGIALAHVSSSLYRNILIIDREGVIGGCHRVKRDYEGIFTEYGPRIYFTIFYNFFMLLKEIGLNSCDIFIPYKYNFISDILNTTWSTFNFYELYIFISSYLRYLINDNHGKTVGLYSYLLYYKFSSKSIELLRNICKHIDNGDLEQVSLNKILKIYDIMVSHKILQPKLPLDVSLFNIWKQFLENRGVDFLLNVDLKNVAVIDEVVSHIILNNGEHIDCDKLVLAVPPISLLGIIKNDEILKDAFGNYNNVERWAGVTKYKDFISITYHFKSDTVLPANNGLSLITDWGIRVINLSEYMKKVECDNNIVLTVAVTLLTNESSRISKCANECTYDEIIRETYRQLKLSYLNSIEYSYEAHFNPNNYYDSKRKEWKCIDNAYLNVYDEQYITFKSCTIDNLYNLGTHNGKSFVPFNTIESAVSNGISLGAELYPDVKKKYCIMRGYYSKDYLIIFILMIHLVLYYYVTNKID
jgi:hypothetical protein